MNGAGRFCVSIFSVPYRSSLRFVGLDLVSSSFGLRTPKDCAASRKVRPYIDPGFICYCLLMSQDG